MTEQSIDIDGSGQGYVMNDIVATKTSDYAAVGGVVGSPQKVLSEPECLYACVNFVKGCQMVTTGQSRNNPCSIDQPSPRLRVCAMGQPLLQAAAPPP